MAPPRGGPEDRDAPRVIAHAPDSGAVGVARDAPLVIEFSEKMNRSRVRDGLRIAPWPGKLACAWSETRLTCEAVAGWREATTYTVLVGAPATDARRNALAPPLLFAFSTGDSLARGRVAGTLHTRSLRAGEVPVFLFAWPEGLQGPLVAEAALRPDALEALRIAETAGDGSFVFPFVPVGRPLLAAALFDRNENRTYDEGSDLWGFSEFPVVVADSGADADSLALYLVFADEEGDLSGSVLDSTCAAFVPASHLRAQVDSLAGMLSGDRDATGFARLEGDSLPRIELTAAEIESVQVELGRLETRLVSAAA